jgi:hypothetical protein
MLKLKASIICSESKRINYIKLKKLDHQNKKMIFSDHIAFFQLKVHHKMQ